jgi:hypothetical protein
MKPLLSIIIIIFTFFNLSAQNRNLVIAELKNNEVSIKLHRLIDFNDSKAKEGNKFVVADITLENISNKNIEMGAEYTMGITIKDANGNEYRSGLKGEGIVSSYLIKDSHYDQDQKAHNLSFGDMFPPKTKARSLLCGFEVPKDAKIVFFGVKKKNMWGDIKK